MTDQSDILLGAEAAPQQQAQTVPTNTPVESTVTHDPIKEKLASIRNEEGLQKYASVEDALTGAAHAQEFIQILKAEKQAALEQLEAERKAREDAANQLASTKVEQPPAVQGLGKEDVYSAMEEYERSKVRKSNRKSVVDTLVNHCNGDEAKAAELISNRLRDLGMTREQLASLSESSPNAVYNLFNINGKSTKPAMTGNTINTDAIEAHVSKEAPKAKRMPVGASNSHLVNEWRTAVAETNANLGIN